MALWPLVKLSTDKRLEDNTQIFLKQQWYGDIKQMIQILDTGSGNNLSKYKIKKKTKTFQPSVQYLILSKS